MEERKKNRIIAIVIIVMGLMFLVMENPRTEFFAWIKSLGLVSLGISLFAIQENTPRAKVISKALMFSGIGLIAINLIGRLLPLFRTT